MHDYAKQNEPIDSPVLHPGRGMHAFNPISFYHSCRSATERFAGYAWHRRISCNGISASASYSSMD